jgi:phosphoribosylanthranilate isomerase
MNSELPAYSGRVRVKICGITSPHDGVTAAQLGADSIGLNFFAPSPRFVAPDVARAICFALPPFINRVALFVNEERERVLEVLDVVPADTLQFHGDETAQYCESFGLPYIKSVGVKPGIDVAAQIAQYRSAAGILLDSHDRVRWGGTGEAFDWALIPGERHTPLILAGGLNAENVAQAIQTVRPDAVDVSGGVEREKGIKDPSRIEAFIRGIRSV